MNLNVTDKCNLACEAQPECSVCHLPKPPIGRDVPPAAAGGYCEHECPGHNLLPLAGHLWPGELKEARDGA